MKIVKVLNAHEVDVYELDPKLYDWLKEYGYIYVDEYDDDNYEQLLTHVLFEGDPDYVCDTAGAEQAFTSVEIDDTFYVFVDGEFDTLVEDMLTNFYQCGKTQSGGNGTYSVYVHNCLDPNSKFEIVDEATLLDLKAPRNLQEAERKLLEYETYLKYRGGVGYFYSVLHYCKNA